MRAIPAGRSDDLSPAAKTARLFQKAAIPMWSAGLMILAVVFSRSRGGILVMVLIAALFIYLLSFSRRFKALFAGSLLLFICLYGGIIGFDEVIKRFATFYESSLARFDIWYKSLAMLRDHIFTGIGMGGYEFLSPAYLKDMPAGYWYDRAHNEYVELAIELGMPMMLLFLAWDGQGHERVRPSTPAEEKGAPGAFPGCGSMISWPSAPSAALPACCCMPGWTLSGACRQRLSMR